MAGPIETPRAARQSILEAAVQVETVGVEGAPEALRNAAAALEFHLDTLAMQLRRRALEPRLLHMGRKLESRLREALVGAWTAEREPPAGTLGPEGLARVASLMRKAASTEMDLVFEQLRDVEALD